MAYLRSWVLSSSFHTNSVLGSHEWLILDNVLNTPFSKLFVLKIPQILAALSSLIRKSCFLERTLIASKSSAKFWFCFSWKYWKLSQSVRKCSLSSSDNFENCEITKLTLTTFLAIISASRLRILSCLFSFIWHSLSTSFSTSPLFSSLILTIKVRGTNEANDYYYREKVFLSLVEFPGRCLV